MYSVAVNNDTIKDKVGLLNTLVLELDRLYRGKTFADIIREKLLNELNKIHPVNKKVTESTTDVNEVYDEYKKAYHKDLDLKTVPCVIARDKMLSGWGGAEGRTHYQVVLCADSTEAHNIAHNMQAVAQREQLANIRTNFGVKLPSRASVAYVVGRYAPAWNMGDSWYTRYDNKKEEGRRETKLGNKIVRWAYENFKDIAFIEDGKLSDGSDYLEFDASRPKLEEFKKALATEFGNNIEFGTSQSEYAPEIQNLVVIIPKKSNKTEVKNKKLENKSIKVKGLRKLEGIRAIEEYEYEFDDLYDIVGENGKSVLDDIRNANKEDEFIDYLISIMGEDVGKLPTVGELSDFIDYDYETIFRDLEMKTENKKKTKVKNKKLENIQGNHQGICPKCGSMITNYGHIFWDDEGIGQEFNCTNPECKAHGTEYYNTTFDYIEVEED